VTQTETTQGSPESSSASAPAARKRAARKRTTRTAGTVAGAGRKAMAGRKKTLRKARNSSRKQRSALDNLVQGLAKKASEARVRVADFSEEQAAAARRAAGKVAAASKKTIERVRKEWNGMDNARKVAFVAALLGALAAASGSLVASKKKK